MAATLVDEGVQSTIITGLSQEAVAASSSRTRRWDQLSEDSASMWAVYMTSPNVMTGQGIRMLAGTPTTSPLQAPLPQPAPG